MPVLPRIHATASVSPGAQVADTATIGPNVVLEDDVMVEDRAELLAGTVLHAGSRVGADCRLGPYAVVGGEPMDTSFRGEPSYAVLEAGVVLREFATVHRATGEGAATRVGAGTLVMSYAHVSHNVQVGQKCVLTTSVQLGGHSEVGDYAVLGAGALLHQFCRVGRYAMYGAGSATNRDVLPFSMARGNLAIHYRLNKVGLQRNGVTGPRYAALEHAIRAFRKRDWATLETLAETSDDVRAMLEFKQTSRRGLCAFV
ncbi:acyl-ACP--UDP-N-acetylglucosamine O-acyltransferase [soil metagenome]